MILGNMKTVFSADTSNFRSAVNQSMQILDKFSSKIQSTAGDMKTLGGKGVGDSFRVPAGFADGGKFAGVTRAMEIYVAKIQDLEANLDTLKADLMAVNAPLRQDAVSALMASDAMGAAAISTQSFTVSTMAAAAPVTSTAVAVNRMAATIRAVEVPVSRMTRFLRYFGEVNYDVRASIESWNTLAVFSGPGKLIVLLDRLKDLATGVSAPMRMIQVAVRMYAVPALATWANTLAQASNNPAAAVFSRNLEKFARDVVNFGDSVRTGFGGRTFAAIGSMIGVMSGGVREAGALSVRVGGLVYTVGDVLTAAAGRAALAMGGLAISTYKTATSGATAATVTQRMVGTWASVKQSASSAFETFAQRSAAMTTSLNASMASGAAASAVFRVLRTTVLSAAGAIAGVLVSAASAATGATVRAAGGLIQMSIAATRVLIVNSIRGAVQGLTQSIVQLGIQAVGTGMKMASSAARYLTFGMFSRRAAAGVDASAAAMKRAGRSAGGLRMGLSSLSPQLSMLATMGPIVGAALAIVGGTAKGMSFAAQTEDTLTAYKTMLGGSAEKAAQLNAQISQFASATPFELPELRGAAQTLLGFNVAQEQIIPNMQMLGNIAAGTGKPINDLALAYGKMKARGVADMEHLNTFMEAGAIDAGKFAAQMGMTREALFKAVENKDISFGDVQRGLIAATSEGGKFYGMIQAKSQTVNGLMSTLKDNVNIALGQIGEKLFTAFNVRGILQGMIAITGWISDTMVPAVFAAGERIALFFQPIGVTIYSTIMPYLMAFAEGVQTAFLMAEFVAINWRETLIVAATGAMLSIVRFGAIAQYTFTTVIPAVLQWFWENWRDIFFTIMDFTATVMINIGQNIRNLFTALYDFLASGGTKSFEFAFIPLTEGFTNTIRKLPEIAAREIGPMESTLAASFDKSSAALKGSFEDFKIGKQISGMLDRQAAAGSKTIGAVIPDDEGEKGKDGKKKKGKAEGELKALEFGSAETFKAAFGRGDDKLYKQGETANKLGAEQVKALKEIKNKIGAGGAESVPKL